MVPKDENEGEIVKIYDMLNQEGLLIEEGIEKIFTISYGEDVFYSFTSKCKCREIEEKSYQIIN